MNRKTDFCSLYPQKTAAYLLRRGCRIKFLGDSHTAGAGSSDDDRDSGDIFITIDGKEFREQKGHRNFAALLGDYMNEKFGCTYVNRGCSGITSTTLRGNLAYLADEQDELVFLTIGGNNRKLENGMIELYNDLIYIVDTLRLQGKEVILMGKASAVYSSETKPTNIYKSADVSNTISQVADEKNCLYVNHFIYLNNFCLMRNIDIADLLISDGGHLNDKGHYLFFINMLQTLGFAPPALEFPIL